MNPTKALSGVALVLALLTAVCWLYVRATRCVIVSQKTYGSWPAEEMVTRGYAVRSSNDLKIALSKYGVAEFSFDSERGAVNFNNEFVFIVENGSLLEVYRGNSGFDIAAVKPSTNLSAAIVRGPKSRPLKAVAR